MADATDPTPGERRLFVPVLAAGLGSAALVAIAGNQAWAEAADSGSGAAEQSVASVAVAVGQAKAPLATALALVVLASWGVVLVTRGRFRRAVMWLAALAAAALLVAVIVTWQAAPGVVRDAFATYGVTDLEVSRTVWCWVAVVAAVISCLAAAAGARVAGRWPEMGRRYDSPIAEPATDSSHLGMWKAMDEGHDPTADTSSDTTADSSSETSHEPDAAEIDQPHKIDPPDRRTRGGADR